MRRFLTGLVMLSCFSCRTGRELAAADVNAGPFIGFVTFRIQDSAKHGIPGLKVLNAQRSPGALKKALGVPGNSANRLSLHLYNGRRFMDSVSIDHPLYPKAEYSDESGRLVTRLVHLDSADFFIRFQVPAVVDEIRVVEYRYGFAPRSLPPVKLER